MKPGCTQACISSPTLPLPDRGALGKSLGLTEPQFPHLYNGDRNCTYFPQLMRNHTDTCFRSGNLNLLTWEAM